MKISIWQQFSSNHSGFFWVVGTFQTIEKADEAFAEMRNMLFKIDEWHREHPEEAAKALQLSNDPLPPEKEFAEKYHARWPDTIDWTNWAQYHLEKHPGFHGYNAKVQSERLINEAVRIVGRNLVVDSPDQTWMTTQPFEDILKALGAETIGYDLKFIESEASKGFALHNRLVFTAPNELSAIEIEQALEAYISADLDAPDNPPPWKNDVENFQAVLGKSKLLKREYIDLLQKNWQQDYELSQLAGQTPYSETLRNKRLSLLSKPKAVIRTDLQFQLDDIWFNNQELASSAMIAWLETLGCTNIDFFYVSKSD